MRVVRAGDRRYMDKKKLIDQSIDYIMQHLDEDI